MLRQLRSIWCVGLIGGKGRPSPARPSLESFSPCALSARILSPASATARYWHDDQAKGPRSRLQLRSRGREHARGEKLRWSCWRRTQFRLGLRSENPPARFEQSQWLRPFPHSSDKPSEYWRCDGKDNHSLPRLPPQGPECRQVRRNRQRDDRCECGRALGNIAVFLQSISSQSRRPNQRLFVERRTSKVETRRLNLEGSQMLRVRN